MNTENKNKYDWLDEDVESNQTIITNNDYIVLSGSPLGNFPFTTDDKLSATKRIKNMESYTSIDKFIVLNNPETIARQMIKKIIRLIRNGENVNSDGLYTDYLLKDNWRIYYY